MKRLAVFLCLLVAGASLCHAQGPQAEMALNGTSFTRGGFFSATFRLDQSITQPFTAFAVVILPDGSTMLDALTLRPNVKPVASNVPRLNLPFSYPLISLNLPQGAPFGQYEVVAVFFGPGKPIHGRQDAFLDVSAKFEIPDPSGSGDIVKIGSMYVASKWDGTGCAAGEMFTWLNAKDWADGLVWLSHDDWRLPVKDELSAICAVKDSTPGFTYKQGSAWYWSSTGIAGYPTGGWMVNFHECLPSDNAFMSYVRAVRGVE